MYGMDVTLVGHLTTVWDVGPMAISESKLFCALCKKDVKMICGILSTWEMELTSVLSFFN